MTTDDANNNNKTNILILGRGIHALSLIRILGYCPNTNTKEKEQSHHQNTHNNFRITLGTTVGYQDLGCWSSYVDHIILLPRPDVDLNGYCDGICQFVNHNLKRGCVIIPVLEETMFLSKISSKIHDKANNKCRILVSPFSTLCKLKDPFQFYHMLQDNDLQNKNHTGKDIGVYLAKSVRVDDTKKKQDLISAITTCFQQEESQQENYPISCKVLCKPMNNNDNTLVSCEQHVMIHRDDWFHPDKQDESRNEIIEKCCTLSSSCVIQEYIEGKKLSCLSLCLNGKVQSHVVTTTPRDDNIMTSIETLVSSQSTLYARTLQFVSLVAQSLNLTGHFGMNFIQKQTNGHLVPLDCHPSVTHGLAFLTPRFSMLNNNHNNTPHKSKNVAEDHTIIPQIAANRIQQVIMDWVEHQDDEDEWISIPNTDDDLNTSDNVSLTNATSTKSHSNEYNGYGVLIRPDIDGVSSSKAHSMTILATLSDMIEYYQKRPANRDKNSCCIMWSLLELVWSSYDTVVWWKQDVMPFLVALVRTLVNAIYVVLVCLLYQIQKKVLGKDDENTINTATTTMVKERLLLLIQEEEIAFVHPKHHHSNDSMDRNKNDDDDSNDHENENGKGNDDETDCDKIHSVGGLVIATSKNSSNNNNSNKSSSNENPSNRKRILVTGATGFLGKRVVETLFALEIRRRHQQPQQQDEDQEQEESNTLPKEQNQDKQQINVLSKDLLDMIQSCFQNDDFFIESITATDGNIQQGKQFIDSLLHNSRDNSNNNNTQRPRVHYVPADLSDARETFQLLQGHNIVIDCAAATATTWSGNHTDTATQRKNLASVQHMAHACHVLSIEKWIHVSSLLPTRSDLKDLSPRLNVKESDYYSSHQGNTVAETITRVRNQYDNNDVSSTNPIPKCVLLHPSNMFGPGDTTATSLLCWFMDQLKQKRLWVIETKRCIGDYTHVDNVVYSCLLCAFRDAKENKNNNDSASRNNNTVKVYNVTNEEPQFVWDIIQTICDKTKQAHPYRWIIIPRWLASRAACGMKVVALLQWLLWGDDEVPYYHTPTTLWTRKAIHALSVTCIWDISQIQKDYGYKSIVPFQQGLEDYLESVSRDGVST